MLLVIDVGNSNTVLGMYQEEQLVRSWRVTTDKSRTLDEYAMLIHELFHLSNIHFTYIRDVIISCVVGSRCASASVSGLMSVQRPSADA